LESTAPPADAVSNPRFEPRRLLVALLIIARSNKCAFAAARFAVVWFPSVSYLLN
jgi:hypothetical protein